MLTDDQLLRYSRQIMLPQIDIAGQEKLAIASIVIVGLGGLGSPVAMYLAAAGVAKITLIDDDVVDSSNLQRQIIHQHQSTGQSKVESAKQRLLSINPDIRIDAIGKRLDLTLAEKVIFEATVVVDCCDNFETRFLVNRICYQHKTPLVSGAAIRWEGQLTTFMMDQKSPCYRCLYDEDSFTDQSCSQNGVVGPVVGIIGSMQALEAIKVITDAGKVAVGQLTLLDGLDLSFSKINYRKKEDCPVCG